MTALERALHDIANALESLGIQYAVVDGIANAIWGEPRATIDVDVTISVDEKELTGIVSSLAEHFRSAVPEPVTFVQQTRVLPLDSVDGVRIDVIFALMPFELEAIRRASAISIGDRAVRVVTAEDLILMKIISDRPRDLADAEAIARRHLPDLDRVYLDPRIRELALILEQPDIADRWWKWTSG